MSASLERIACLARMVRADRFGDRATLVVSHRQQRGGCGNIGHEEACMFVSQDFCVRCRHPTITARCSGEGLPGTFFEVAALLAATRGCLPSGP